MSETVLVTRDLSKNYREIKAVDHVSIAVKLQDIYGLIGVKGAGKTTFLHMLCGLARPSAGEIELLGAQGARALRNVRKSVGVSLEKPAVDPNLSAMENLEVQRRCLKLKRKNVSREMLEELLEMVGLEKMGKKKAGQYPLEGKRRLGIAAALAGSPKLLLLDEPTIGLDSEGIAGLRSLLRQINQEKGVTILFSSHNLSELEGVATRYGFLHEGKLLREFTAEELERDRRIWDMDLEKYFLNLMARLKREVAR